MGAMERMSNPALGEGDVLDNLHLHPKSLRKGINSASTSGQQRLVASEKVKSPPRQAFWKGKGFTAIMAQFLPPTPLYPKHSKKKPTALLHAVFFTL